MHNNNNIQGSFQLLVEVYDTDDFSADDFIDLIFAAPFNLTVGSSITQSYTGRRAIIEFTFQVHCATNFYGSSCSTLCVEMDSDIAGHYTCNPVTGEKMCLPGFKNPSTNCTTGKSTDRQAGVQ